MESNVAQLPLSDKLWAWFETNKKQTMWGVAIVLFVGLIAGFIFWRHGEKEVAAGQALSNLTAKQLTVGARQDNAADYLQIASKYPNSSAGARALLLAAGSLFSDGKFSEAQAQFERFTREYHGSPYLSEALLGTAACLDAQGKTNEAAAAYKNLVDRHSSDNVALQAKFSLACIYEAQNKLDQARNLFEDAARSDPYGSIGSEAAMRSEELKPRLPTLAPSVPSAPVGSNPPVKIEKK